MVIDLTDIPAGYVENYMDEYQLKSSKLFKEINSINSKMNKKYNYIIIPMPIYNIIECDTRFRPASISEGLDLRKVGTIGDIECYLDIYLPPDRIIISWDKQTEHKKTKKITFFIYPHIKKLKSRVTNWD